jgi:hypothetical protein
MTITFTADAGFNVRLYGFDLGGWPNANYTIPNLLVKNGAGTNLYSASNLLVKGAAPAPRHTTIEFDTPLEANVLQIYINLAGLGGASDNIGIDNIAFDQTEADVNVVPEPSTWALLASGAIALFCSRRFNRK